MTRRPGNYYDWYPEVYVQGLGSCHQVTNDASAETTKREPLGFQFPKKESPPSVTEMRRARKVAFNRHRK